MAKNWSDLMEQYERKFCPVCGELGREAKNTLNRQWNTSELEVVMVAI